MTKNYTYHQEFEGFIQESFSFLVDTHHFKSSKAQHDSQLSECLYRSSTFDIRITYEWREGIGDIHIETPQSKKRLFEFFPLIWTSSKKYPPYHSSRPTNQDEQNQNIIKIRDALKACMPYLMSKTNP